MKKSLRLIVAIAIIMTMQVNAFALDKTDQGSIGIDGIDYETVIEKSENLLQAAIQSGSYAQLLNKSSFNVGEEIPLYEDLDFTLCTRQLKYYPVFSENEIVGMIIARVATTKEVILEFNDAFCDELNKYYHNNEPICMITNNKTLWIVDGNAYQEIYSEENNISKLSISEQGALSNMGTLQKKIIKENTDVTVNPTYDTQGTVVTGTKSLSVPIKLQSTGSSYCWACVASSVGQYKKPSVVITPEKLAIEYAGDLNTSKSFSTIKKILSEKYNVSTSQKNVHLKMSDLQKNINAGNPVAAHISYSLTTGHFVVVRGYKVTEANKTTMQYSYIMDSLAGNRTLAVDREIKYYSVSSGTEYNMNSYLEL